jgi:hypothetical protein
MMFNRVVVWWMCSMVLFAALSGCRMPTSCVVSGTAVRTPEGVRPIESLRTGDVILTLDEKNDLVRGRIVALSAAPARSWLRVTLQDGTQVQVTDAHPLAMHNKTDKSLSWAEARSVRVGDSLVTEHGAQTARKIERLHGLTTVFDLTVEPHESFLADGVLVHNKRKRGPPTLESLRGTWIAYNYRMEISPTGKLLLMMHGHVWEGTLPTEGTDTYRSLPKKKFLVPLKPVANLNRDQYVPTDVHVWLNFYNGQDAIISIEGKKIAVRFVQVAHMLEVQKHSQPIVDAWLAQQAAQPAVK